jgi:uncharacterized hydrophobic protein (TIGR00271 family)
MNKTSVQTGSIADSGLNDPRVSNPSVKDDDILFFANLVEQRQAVDTLVKESRTDGDYYFYLIISGLIAALGLINDNLAIVIAAMLVAPALFPILSLGLAVVTASKQATLRAIKAIGVSFAAVVLTSTVVVFMFQYLLNGESINQTVVLVSSPNITSFFVAGLSALIASYAWVKQSQSALLPGVAIAVSLVPPLANIGVGAVLLSADVFTGSLISFIVNLITITLVSALVFSVFGFSQMRNWQSLRLRQENRELEKNKQKLENTIAQINGDDSPVIGEDTPGKTDTQSSENNNFKPTT